MGLYTRFVVRNIAFGLAAWLILCGLMTEMLAWQFVHYMEKRAHGFQDAAISSISLKDPILGYAAAEAESEIGFTLHWNHGFGSIHPLLGSHDVLSGVTLSVHSDEDENGVIRRSISDVEERQIFEEVAYVITEDDATVTGRSHMSFPYVSADNWTAGNTYPNEYATVYMDIPYYYNVHMEYFSTKGYGEYVWKSPHYWDGDLLRLTGYFDTGWKDKNVFHPVSIEKADFPEIKAEDIYEVNQIDREGDTSWETLATYDIPLDGKEVQTIYGWNISSGNHMYEPFSISGREYTDLVQLIEENRWKVPEEGVRIGTLLEMVVLTRGEVMDLSCTIALRFRPLQYVLTHGWYIYLISFLVIGLCVYLSLTKIKRTLALPLEDTILHRKLFRYQKKEKISPEVLKVLQMIQDRDQKLAETTAEVKRLNTALSYAADAEENRRQLVSNLTHDLKTPIAIIHSYAEGLQAGIAADKQERYLSVIMEETERLDAMVLQMLDLSRLEAGKVKLATDQFSLLSVLQDITERFAPLMEAKEISLFYKKSEDFIVTADEARIRQVLTNLVENAMKYCPVQGQIQLTVGKNSDSDPMAYFLIENPSVPLSVEALKNVWNNFFRTDPSRKEPGTGLGLAIVKSIVELHGGTCTVRNTETFDGQSWKTGVEFGFTLPLR